jgi:DNA-binding protein H-NS
MVWTFKGTDMATLKQIQMKLKKLQTQTESLIAQRAQAVLDDIRALMERHGLTTADIETHRKKGRRAKQLNVQHPAPAGRREKMNTLASKGKLPAKYRNPKTGETWSGWARPPAWIASVKDRSRFLIDAEGSEEPVKPRKVAAKKASASTAAKSATAKAKKTAAKKAPAAKKTTPAKKASAAKKSASTKSPKAAASRKSTAPRRTGAEPVATSQTTAATPAASSETTPAA